MHGFSYVCVTITMVSLFVLCRPIVLVHCHLTTLLYCNILVTPRMSTRKPTSSVLSFARWEQCHSPASGLLFSLVFLMCLMWSTFFLVLRWTLSVLPVFGFVIRSVFSFSCAQIQSANVSFVPCIFLRDNLHYLCS